MIDGELQNRWRAETHITSLRGRKKLEELVRLQQRSQMDGSDGGQPLQVLYALALALNLQISGPVETSILTADALKGYMSPPPFLSSQSSCSRIAIAGHSRRPVSSRTKQHAEDQRAAQWRSSLVCTAQ